MSNKILGKVNSTVKTNIKRTAMKLHRKQISTVNIQQTHFTMSCVLSHHHTSLQVSHNVYGETIPFVFFTLRLIKKNETRPVSNMYKQSHMSSWVISAFLRSVQPTFPQAKQLD